MTSRRPQRVNAGYTVGGVSHELGYGGALAVAAAPHVTIAGELLLRRIGDLQTITPIAFPHPAIGGVNTIRLMPQGPARTTAVGVIGMKWNLAETWLLNASALLPLTNAGLNAKVVPMVTVDYGW